MTWQPKLVALDVDGTVIDHDRVLPDEVRAAVGRVVAAGVPVVLATGRSWHGTQPIFAALELPPGLAVCANGAVVVHYPPLAQRALITFDPAPVIDRVLEVAPSTLIAVEQFDHGFRVSKPFPDGDLSGEWEVAEISELRRHPATRVVIRDPAGDAEQITALAERLGLHGVGYFIGWSAWLDIAPAGVNKATGLELVCAELGVQASDVLALGDGLNDLEMLRWAGRGVAIGDARDAVKEAADYVTGPFAEGGTVVELDRWFAAGQSGT